MKSWPPSQVSRSLSQAFFSRWTLLGLGAVLLCATGAHLYTQFSAPKPRAPVAFLDHVFDLALTLALVGMAMGVGNAVLTRCRYAFAQPLDRVLFSLAVGSGIMATAILFCGSAAGLQLPILIGLIVLIVVLTRGGMREVPGLVRSSVSSVLENGHPAGLATFSVIVVFMLARAMLPVSDWDSLMYHLRVPAQFVQQGRIYLPEDNLHASVIQLVHMLYLFPLALKSAAGPALLSMMYAVGMGLAVFACSLRFFNRSVASGCLVMLWGNTAMLLVAVTPRIDVTIAFYAFLAHYALLEALVSASSRMFFLAAVLLGFAIGAKMNAIPYVLALSPLIVWTSWRCQRAPLATLRWLVLFGSLVLGVAAPWLLKTWLLFGAPLYPYFTAIGVEPWLTVLSAGQISVAEADQIFHEFVKRVRVSFSLSDPIRGLLRVNLLEWGGPYYVSPLLGLLPLWALFRGHKQVGWLIVPALAYTLIAIVKAPAMNVRYLIPAMPALTIAATYFAYCLCARLFTAWRARAAFSFLAVLAMLPASAPLVQWVTNPEAVRYLSGVGAQDAYLHTEDLGGVAPPVSHELPRDSRVLMVFEARGYYFDVPVLQDNRLMNWLLLLKTDSPLSCLKASGISHVLVNTGALGYYILNGIDREFLRVDAFKAFASRCLVPIRQGPEFILYQVKN